MGVSAAGSDIKVAIFDDMLEITSPGALPDIITTEVTTEVLPEVRLVSALDGELSRKEIMDRLGLKKEGHFRKTHLAPALKAGLVERTIPTKPQSSKQRYRLTQKGRKKGL